MPLAWQDPALAFACWADEPYVAWLDSQGPASGRDRYSYLAVEPFRVLRAADGDGCPLSGLGTMLGRHRFDWPDAPVPFAGGAVGFIGYEAASRLSGVEGHSGLPFPGYCFAFYDVVLAFDRVEERTWLLSSGLPERSVAGRARRARSRTEAVLSRLACRPAPSAIPAPLAWRAETSRLEHEARVARTVAYIEEGDICQANITGRFLASRERGAPPSALYAMLRAANPAPYGAYLGCGAGLAVCSVSPERFLGLAASGEIEARPIKGTRPRGADAAADALLAAALVASGKDRAENLMIVDLLRHDIGRVARIGSVRVPELAALETFQHVHHLVSSVRGQLRPGLGAIDLLSAALPGGSITGAPKLRAMQIIRALEPGPRGPYCGAIAWIGWDGAMDSAIAIRTMTVTRNAVIAQAGGGIVADSDPAAEYEEMMVKIRPLLRALGAWPG